MSICEDCNQEMQGADACTMNILVIATQEGKIAERYRRSTSHFLEPSSRCNDCGIKHGGIHHFGCDVERCPKCGLQLIGCECFDPPKPLQACVQSLSPEEAKRYNVSEPAPEVRF